MGGGFLIVVDAERCYRFSGIIELFEHRTLNVE